MLVERACFQANSSIVPVFKVFVSQSEPMCFYLTIPSVLQRKVHGQHGTVLNHIIMCWCNKYGAWPVVYAVDVNIGCHTTYLANAANRARGESNSSENGP